MEQFHQHHWRTSWRRGGKIWRTSWWRLDIELDLFVTKITFEKLVGTFFWYYKFSSIDAAVEDDEGPKLTKKVEKTTWDWTLVNNAKPIWTRKPNEIEVAEYNDFYKSITKDTNGPMAYTHFIAEGEVTFKSLLFVPVNQKSEEFQKYGDQDEQIKLYVRRVFITNDFKG